MTSLQTAVAEVLVDTLASAARIGERDGHDLGELMDGLAALLVALTDTAGGTTAVHWHPLAAD